MGGAKGSRVDALLGSSESRGYKKVLWAGLQEGSNRGVTKTWF